MRTAPTGYLLIGARYIAHPLQCIRPSLGGIDEPGFSSLDHELCSTNPAIPAPLDGAVWRVMPCDVER